MPSSPVKFLKISDWTNAFYDGVIWTHQKIDEMDSCLEETHQLHVEFITTPGLQRPARWRTLDENVIKFGVLHNTVVDLVNMALDALNTCWESNDEAYADKYMEVKPLRRRFEQTVDAFNKERATYSEKAREKIENYLAGNISKQVNVAGDLPSSSAAIRSGSSTESQLRPCKPTCYGHVALAPKSEKRATHNVVEDGQNIPKEKKPLPKGFVCDLCTKKLGSLHGLNDHKKDAHGVPIKPPPTAPKDVMDEYHRQLGIYCQQQMDKLQMT